MLTLVDKWGEMATEGPYWRRVGAFAIAIIVLLAYFAVGGLLVLGALRIALGVA